MLDEIVQWLLLPLATYGLCFVVKDAKITTPIRVLVCKVGFFRELLSCTFCTAFWCSLGTAAFYYLVLCIASYWLIVLWPFAGATICYAIDLKLRKWESEVGDE